MTKDNLNNDDVDVIENYNNEANALQKVISVFNDLQPDVRKRLLQTIATFYRIDVLGGGSEVRKGTSFPPYHTESSLPTFSEDRTISPKEFLLEKKPQTDVERVACLAYYLTHYRDKPHFKTIDISKMNTESAQIKLSNATMAVNNAASYGYLAQATKGHKQLSAAGELFVRALPDRHAAKEEMKRARPRRKSKTATTKKV